MQRAADRRVPASLRRSPCWVGLLRAARSHLLGMNEGATEVHAMPCRQHRPNRVTRDPEPPRDLLDRDLLGPIQPTNLCPMRHSDHPPGVLGFPRLPEAAGSLLTRRRQCREDRGTDAVGAARDRQQTGRLRCACPPALGLPPVRSPTITCRNRDRRPTDRGDGGQLNV